MTTWYGSDPAWRIPLERDARREHRRGLSSELRWGELVYRMPVDVPGRREPVRVTIAFRAYPPYECFGLRPEEYPRVFADRGLASPHRMPEDDALCLYFPASPAAERWVPADGLLALIDLVRDHLFFEGHWRATGGHAGGDWLGTEAAHGFPAGRAA